MNDVNGKEKAFALLRRETEKVIRNACERHHISLTQEEGEPGNAGREGGRGRDSFAASRGAMKAWLAFHRRTEREGNGVGGADGRKSPIRSLAFGKFGSLRKKRAEVESDDDNDAGKRGGYGGKSVGYLKSIALGRCRKALLSLREDALVTAQLGGGDVGGLGRVEGVGKVSRGGGGYGGNVEEREREPVRDTNRREYKPAVGSPARTLPDFPPSPTKGSRPLSAYTPERNTAVLPRGEGSDEEEGRQATAVDSSPSRLARPSSAHPNIASMRLKVKDGQQVIDLRSSYEVVAERESIAKGGHVSDENSRDDTNGNGGVALPLSSLSQRREVGSNGGLYKNAPPGGQGRGEGEGEGGQGNIVAASSVGSRPPSAQPASRLVSMRSFRRKGNVMWGSQSQLIDAHSPTSPTVQEGGGGGRGGGEGRDELGGKTEEEKRKERTWLSKSGKGGEEERNKSGYEKVGEVVVAKEGAWIESYLRRIPSSGWLDVSSQNEMQDYHLNMMVETAAAMGVQMLPSGVVRVEIEGDSKGKDEGGDEGGEGGRVIAGEKEERTMWEEGRMKGINMSGCWRIKGSFLPSLVRHFRFLTVLNLRGCQSIQVGHLCEALRFVKKTLRELDLSAVGEQLSDNEFGRVVQSAPQIERLLVSGCSGLTDASLISMATTADVLLRSGEIEYEEERRLYFPHCLAYFDCSWCPRVSNVGLERFAESTGTLKSLNMHGAGIRGSEDSDVSDAAVHAFIRFNRNSLESLYMGMTSITDEAIARLARDLRRIRMVSIHGCKRVRPSCLLVLARYQATFGPLVLDASKCTLVEDENAVKSATSVKPNLIVKGAVMKSITSEVGGA